jgi:hypothetical protein
MCHNGFDTMGFYKLREFGYGVAGEGTASFHCCAIVSTGITKGNRDEGAEAGRGRVGKTYRS